MTEKKESINPSYELKYLFYKNYVKSTTTALNGDFRKLKKRLDKKISADKGLPIFSILKSAAMEISQEKFTVYFNDSSFIFLYSTFESDLKNICMHTQKALKHKLAVTDIAGGNYIEKSKTYLTKVVGIDLGNLNEEWEKIKTYQKIRNYLTHNSSTIPPEMEKPVGQRSVLYKTISDSGNFSLNKETGEFHIATTDYLIRFCDDAVIYLSAILNRMDTIFPA
jgi:hypothetical protein